MVKKSLWLQHTNKKFISLTSHILGYYPDYAEPYVYYDIPVEPYVHEDIPAEPYVHEEVAAEPYVHDSDHQEFKTATGAVSYVRQNIRRIPRCIWWRYTIYGNICVKTASF